MIRLIKRLAYGNTLNDSRNWLEFLLGIGYLAQMINKLIQKTPYGALTTAAFIIFILLAYVAWFMSINDSYPASIIPYIQVCGAANIVTGLPALMSFYVKRLDKYRHIFVYIFCVVCALTGALLLVKDIDNAVFMPSYQPISAYIFGFFCDLLSIFGSLFIIKKLLNKK